MFDSLSPAIEGGHPVTGSQWWLPAYQSVLGYYRGNEGLIPRSPAIEGDTL